MRRIGRPLDGRSRSVLLYRLWIREDADPQAGQEAVGDVVRRVSVISKATSTSSTWTSGRSGIMIIGSLSVPENALQKRKNVQLSVYHRGGQQTCVRSINWHGIFPLVNDVRSGSAHGMRNELAASEQ